MAGAVPHAARVRAVDEAFRTLPERYLGAGAGFDATYRIVLGDVDLAVAFEGLFRLPNGRPPLLRIHDVRLPGRRVSTLTMGAGPDVLLIHGLGATKSSFFDTAAALTRSGYRVHALDLPGFGSSSKPLAGPYSARWFAETVVEVMDALGVGRVHLVGNSMGGRVAIEVGLRAPARVKAVALLCPAVAFVRRE